MTLSNAKNKAKEALKEFVASNNTMSVDIVQAVSLKLSKCFGVSVDGVMIKLATLNGNGEITGNLLITDKRTKYLKTDVLVFSITIFRGNCVERKVFI